MSSSQTLYRAPFLSGNDLGNATSETQFQNGRSQLLALQLPTDGKLGNKPFRVRVGGRVSTTTNVTFTFNVYFGISATIASNTLVFSSDGVTVNNATSSWEGWLDCFWSADANQITGRGTGQLNNNVLGPQALNNTPLSANPSRDSSTFLASGSAYGFTCTGQFSGSSTGNHATVDIFDLESV